MTTTRELKAEFEKAISSLERLRDEVRVRVHLGGLDAKKEWNTLEPRIESVLKKAGDEISEVSCKTAKELGAALEKLRSALH